MVSGLPEATNRNEHMELLASSSETTSKAASSEVVGDGVSFDVFASSLWSGRFCQLGVKAFC
jgi:hypothetical protein